SVAIVFDYVSALFLFSNRFRAALSSSLFPYTTLFRSDRVDLLDWRIPLGAAEAERSLGARTGARRAGTRKCCASSESRVTSHESRSMTPPAVDLRLLVPELVVTATAVAVMLAGLFLPAGRQHLLRWL